MATGQSADNLILRLSKSWAVPDKKKKARYRLKVCVLNCV